MLPYEEFDLSGVRTYPLASRTGKVTVADFGQPHRAGDGITAFVDRLPRLLAGADFRAVVDAILAAHRARRPIVWGIGAHVLKTGLSPVLIDLMRRGLVSALATNGAGLITNFHLPKSSLVMLVAAFAGREHVLAAYREAVTSGYRFYSYGDAMLIL